MHGSGDPALGHCNSFNRTSSGTSSRDPACAGDDVVGGDNAGLGGTVAENAMRYLSAEYTAGDIDAACPAKGHLVVDVEVNESSLIAGDFMIRLSEKICEATGDAAITDVQTFWRYPGVGLSRYCPW